MGVELELQAQSGDMFSANLLSVRKAVRAGHTVVFSPDGSFIVGADGTKVPLRDTRGGWELHVQQGGTGSGGGPGMAFDTSTISPLSARE